MQDKYIKTKANVGDEIYIITNDIVIGTITNITWSASESLKYHIHINGYAKYVPGISQVTRIEEAIFINKQDLEDYILAKLHNLNDLKKGKKL